MTTATENPTLEEVVCWLNAWANGREPSARAKGRDFVKGYDAACSDIFDVLVRMVDDDEWLEVWRSRSWERLRASNQEGEPHS